QILGLHYPGNIIESIHCYGKPRMSTLNDFLANLFHGVSKIDPRNLRSGRYERPSGLIAQTKHGFHHVLLRFFENTRLSALLNQSFDLLFRNRRFLSLLFPKEVAHRVSGNIQEANHRGRYLREPAEGDGNNGRDCLRIARSETLGNQLADDERKVSDAEDNQRQGNGLAVRFEDG